MIGLTRTKNGIKESFRMAIDSIRQNKLRSILTLLGISIGVFSVIGVMTAIRTLESSVESGLNVFGTNTFVIQKWPGIMINNRGDEKYRNRKNIDYPQYEEFKRRARMPIMVSVSEGTSARNVKYRDKSVKRSIELVGGDEGTVRTYNTYIADGRNVTRDDVHSARNVCLLGMDVVDRLFPFEDPIGKTIQIRGLDYNVIGITERKGEAFGGSQDNYVAIPITNFLQNFKNRWTTLSISVEAPSAKEYDKTMDEAIGLLRAIRKVPPGVDNDFEIESNAEMIERFSGFTSGIKMFALSISVIALLVAGIGIMNIMLVSVSERTEEIGLRKAIGAKQTDILIQFLFEALILSTIGGLVGTTTGLTGVFLLGVITPLPASVGVTTTFSTMIISGSIGLIFGVLPAKRASQLDPIVALRSL